MCTFNQHCIGGIAPSAKIVQHLKTTGSLKWFLTVDGLIRLHGYGALSLGYRGGDLGEGTTITLALAEASESNIRWKFSVPVFGKKKTTVTEEELSQCPKLDTTEEITIKEAKEEEQHEQAGTKKATTTESSDITERRKLVYATSESWTIILAWRIYFIRRIRQCRTKAELINIIQESRENLYKRLDIHYKRHCRCTNHQELPSEWEISMEHIRELFRLRLFEGVLGKLVSYDVDQEVSIDELGIETIIDETYREIKTYVQEKETEDGISAVVKKEEDQVESMEDAKEQALVLVSGIKTTVRYWLIIIRTRILEAKKNGASDQEITNIIENSRKELSTELSATRTQVVQYEWWSYLVLSGSNNSAQNTIVESIERTETLISKHIDAISYESDEKLISWVDQGEQSVGVELDTSSKHVFGKLAETEKNEKEEKEENIASVQIIEASRKNTSAELVNVQKHLADWYAQLSHDITWCFDSHHKSDNKVDSLLIVVDSAKLDLINYLQEAKLALEDNSSSLIIAERRRIQYSIKIVRATLIAYLFRFRKSITEKEEQNISKSTIADYLEFSFGTEAQKNTLKVLEDVACELTPDTVIKEETQTHRPIVQMDEEKSTGIILIIIVN